MLRTLILLFVIGTANALAAGVMPALPYLSQPEPGQYRAGAVQPDDIAGLADAGIVHVINLRTDAENPGFDEGAAVEAAGMHYHHLPLGSPDDLGVAQVIRLDALLDTVGDEPVLVHCASSNRVGALFALRAAWLEGMDTEQAIDAGRKWGLVGLEDTVRAKLATQPSPALCADTPQLAHCQP